MSNRQPRPSIYVRLMPLMYGLIGAASAIFLNTLFCGRPVASHGNKCKPCPQAAAPPPRKAVTKPLPPLPPDAGVAAAEVTPDVARPAPVAPLPKPDARTTASANTLEGRLVKAIRPCVRARARSFRLGVRLNPDGTVRRVFVARDPGVNGTMSGCIRRQLMEMTLPSEILGSGYVEWRVRKVAGGLSLTLTRPAR